MKIIISKHMRFLTVFVCLILLFNPAWAQEIKIGYVDMNKVFAAYFKTEQAKKHIDEAQAQAQKELQDQVDLFNKNVEAVKRLDAELEKPGLSKEAKDKKAKERDKKAQEAERQEKNIMELREHRLKDLQDQAAQMRQVIVNEIRAVIDEKAKAEKYDLVLDKSGLSSNSVEVVLFSRGNDFSDDIIRIINSKANRDSSRNINSVISNASNDSNRNISNSVSSNDSDEHLTCEEWIEKLHRKFPLSKHAGPNNSDGVPIESDPSGVPRGKVFDVMGKPVKTVRSGGVILFGWKCSDGTVVLTVNASYWDNQKLFMLQSIDTVLK